MTDMKETLTQPTLAINKILVPKNLRKDGWEKKIDELVKLIEENGLLQPPGVRLLATIGPSGETHELAFGFRRLEACKKLGWTTVPVTLRGSKTTGKDTFSARLTENFGREDLSALEEAEAFKHAIDTLGFTAKDLAGRIGKTDGYISQRLSLLKMSEPVKKAVQSGQITPTHARELARVTDEKEQKKFLELAKNMTLPEFKAEVEAASSKKVSNRGRQTKPVKAEPPAKSEKTEKIAKIPIDMGRPKLELRKALADLDVTKKKAIEAGDKLKVEFFKGMMRGVGWAGGMVKDLYSAK